MRPHVFTGLGIFAVLLGGCSASELPGVASESDAVYATEIVFRLDGVAGTDSEAGASATRVDLSDGTFVPDGDLLPQREPPRLVLSSNNWQQVNDVRIYVFRRNTAGAFVYYRPQDADGVKHDFFSVDDFTLKFDISPYVVWWGGTSDRNESHTFTGRMYLPTGEYRFLALARDDRAVTAERRLTDPNEAVSAWGWQPWEESVTRLDRATLCCARNRELSATELFSGCTTESLHVDGTTTHFCRSVPLNRAVAGILLYVEHIPATIRVCTHRTADASGFRDVAVTGLAVVHGRTVSDQVLLASREALAGRLTVVSSGTATVASGNSSGDVSSLAVGSSDPVSGMTSSTSDSSGTDSGSSSSTTSLPFPQYCLLRADIPTHAQVRNGLYVQVSPDNAAHPDALLKGAFVMPQQTNQPTDGASENWDGSLYLVFLGYDSSLKREIALSWRPIRLSGDDDGSCDPYRYPLRANHFYSIGSRTFSPDGSTLSAADDRPLDLRGSVDAEITIRLDSFWHEYYGGGLGSSHPGLALDPDWGEHPGGELEN